MTIEALTIQTMEETIVPYVVPTIPELTFRGFRGEEDYPAMLAVIEGSKEADGVERTDSLADIVRNYQHSVFRERRRLGRSGPGQDLEGPAVQLSRA